MGNIHDSSIEKCGFRIPCASQNLGLGVRIWGYVLGLGITVRIGVRVYRVRQSVGSYDHPRWVKLAFLN